jgi:hypothetical protein
MKKKLNPWFWLTLFSTGAGMALGLFVPLHDGDFEVGDFAGPQILLRFFSFIAAAFIAAGLLFLIFKWSRRFLRRLFTWRILKWCLLALGILLALISLFYAEENWRGRHAWEKYKQEWEAKGEKFDFASFIPPPVPDEQNFALAPIVASSYGRFLDQNGHRLKPENSNVVNRLKLELYRQNFNFPSSTNMPLRGWQTGILTDLKAWQAYYRTMFVTNQFAQGMPSMPMPGAGRLYGGRKIVETNETEEVTVLATNEFPMASQPQSPAADVLLALSKYDSVIEELRQASRLPYVRFPLNYDEPVPYDILFPHLGSLKSCAQVLRLRAISELASDQTENAIADIKLALYLAESTHSEPVAISHEFRMAIVNLAIQPVWEGMVQHKWSKRQLTELDEQLSKLDFLNDYEFVLRSQRAMAVAMIEDLRKTHNAGIVANQWGYEDDELDFRQRLSLLYYHSFPTGWYYQNEMNICRDITTWGISLVNTSDRVINRGLCNETGGICPPLRTTPYNKLEGMLFPSMPVRQYARIQTSVDLARLACALERYRQVHGDYPETLDVVAPQFIGKIPHDIINGQPLHYRRTEDGNFLLYSVGWNGKDDGGVPAKDGVFNFPEKEGDWVWPFPAK